MVLFEMKMIAPTFNKYIHTKPIVKHNHPNSHIIITTSTYHNISVIKFTKIIMLKLCVIWNNLIVKYFLALVQQRIKKLKCYLSYVNCYDRFSHHHLISNTISNNQLIINSTIILHCTYKV